MADSIAAISVSLQVMMLTWRVVTEFIFWKVVFLQFINCWKRDQQCRTPLRTKYPMYIAPDINSSARTVKNYLWWVIKNIRISSLVCSSKCDCKSDIPPRQQDSAKKDPATHMWNMASGHCFKELCDFNQGFRQGVINRFSCWIDLDKTMSARKMLSLSLSFC